MLDFRHESFLALCKIKSYTKAAEILSITQPAVSQHIKYLEEYYGGKLFLYEGKTLKLTQRGEKLLQYALTMSADSSQIRQELQAEETENTLPFGATLSIGEYVMPAAVEGLMARFPHLRIELLVANTDTLLQKLRDGKINFALLEGFFDKAGYDWALFSQEEFIPVCGKGHPLAGQKVPFAQLLDNRLIVREEGSGNRDILEQILHSHCYTVESFRQVSTIGNVNVIKQLVERGHGIAFLYKAAARAELAQGRLCTIEVEGYSARHDFNFVFLKNSIYREEYLRWLNFLKCLCFSY